MDWDQARWRPCRSIRLILFVARSLIPPTSGNLALLKRTKRLSEMGYGTIVNVSRCRCAHV